MLNDRTQRHRCRIRALYERRRLELSTGQYTIRRPKSGRAVQMLQLAHQHQYQQYVTNWSSANANLTLEENALSSATKTLQTIRDLVVQADSVPNNGADLQRSPHRSSSSSRRCSAPPTAQDCAAGSTCSPATPSNTQPFVRGSSGAVS